MQPAHQCAVLGDVAWRGRQRRGRVAGARPGLLSAHPAGGLSHARAAARLHQAQVRRPVGRVRGLWEARG